MDLDDPGQRGRWHAHLAELFADRKVVCGVAPLAGLNDFVTMLAGAGARKPLLVYTSKGAGPVPTEDDAHLVELDMPRSPTMTEDLRRHDHMLLNLPLPVRRAIDDYDPATQALWCTSPFVTVDRIDGRTVVGGRPPAWAALEDKAVVDDLWDAVGYPRAPRRLVAVSDPVALEEASRDLDRGLGVVWVADARDGFNGGGEFTRWVLTPEERAAAVGFFGPRCDRVRVMPFLEGVPCSIHGIVLPDGTAAFRPVELAILHGEGRRLVYGGQGTTWDPHAADRARMRDLVRRTGEHLRERVGYRGAFGIDGVLTADGFRPTELNPRFSGGLTTLARSLDLGLFYLLQLNLTAGRDPGVTRAERETRALAAFDARRTVQPRTVVHRPVVEESVSVAVSWDGRRLRRDPSGGLRLLVGPTSVGAFAKLDVLDADEFGPGDRLGPLNAAMIRFLDEEFRAGFGPVEAAPDVRRSDHDQRQAHDSHIRDDLADTDLLGGQRSSW